MCTVNVFFGPIRNKVSCLELDGARLEFQPLNLLQCIFGQVIKLSFGVFVF